MQITRKRQQSRDESCCCDDELSGQFGVALPLNDLPNYLHRQGISHIPGHPRLSIAVHFKTFIDYINY